MAAGLAEQVLPVFLVAVRLARRAGALERLANRIQAVAHGAGLGGLAGEGEVGGLRLSDFAAYYLDSTSVPASLAARKLANHTHVVWSTGGHTSEPVLLFGYGPGAEGVRGFGPNTRVHDIIRRALGG